MSEKEFEPAMDKVIRKIKKLRDSNNDTTKYDGIKTFFTSLLAEFQGYRMEEMERNLKAGCWVCPRCARQVHVVTDEQLEKIKKGEDLKPEEDTEEFRRAIPNLKEIKDEKDA